jgi:phosphoribosylaminoimidazole-succinocarboxamide synthase
MVYEGKAKRVFATDDPNRVIIEYKDDATAFNGQKRATIEGKGAMNNRISAIFLSLLKEAGVPTHFLGTISETETLAKRVRIVPLEVVVRNIAAGSLSMRLGLPEGKPLPVTVSEFYFKNDALGDPLVNRSHIAALGLALPATVDRMETTALQVNAILRSLLSQKGITLVDFKLEFGVDAFGNLLLADEISPDTCRFWDASSGQSLDKDLFRRDRGGLLEAYEEILRRLGGV